MVVCLMTILFFAKKPVTLMEKGGIIMKISNVLTLLGIGGVLGYFLGAAVTDNVNLRDELEKLTENEEESE